MKPKIRILVVGCGNMGASHARAYHKMEEFEIVGLVSRGPESRQKLSKELGGYPEFSDFDRAIETTKPDAVSINTYPDTHAEYVRKCLDGGAHVFVEKPLANTVEECEEIKE
ncbi:MAG: Gfo/Idh/MocA family protein, partial [Cyclobacteriaceae bacterium]